MVPKFSFDRKRMDALLSEFGEILSRDPTGIDPSDDTWAEIGYLCLAAKNAGPRFRTLILGAAPGEWALRAERLYNKVNPDGDYLSLNIEGDIGHLKMTEEYWKANHANLDLNKLRYAVVSARDGWAYFPVINSESDWGAGMAAWSENSHDLQNNITLTETAKLDRIAANGGKPLEFLTVKAFSLETLLNEIGNVDFIHSDIQAHEGEVFCNNVDILDKLVKMVCIATHGTELEERLSTTFHELGWELEASWPCRTGRDGTFVWSNPRF